MDLAGIGPTELIELKTLLRWRHPRHCPIMPSRFIPVAEQSSPIRAIGRWLLLSGLSRQPAPGAPAFQPAYWERRLSSRLRLMRARCPHQAILRPKQLGKPTPACSARMDLAGV
ncbi:MAG: EAL domain-containing protein [Thiohalocapsa sp. PB-PSB1]|nr:MAG: EAL domain-containing protein [Thiohalocapsa sp. PB-PSB1]